MSATRATRRLAVVGGVAAGLSAASRARRLDGDLEIVVFERTGYCSYTACGLPYLIGGTIDDVGSLIVRDAKSFRDQGIDVRLRHEVVGLDLDLRSLRVRDLENGGERTESFDELAITAGAAPVRGDFGGGLDGVFVLRTVEDAVAIQAWLERERPRDAVIVGGGYIGLEMAEALRDRGLAVTIVERDPQLLPFVDRDVAAAVEEELSRNRVRVLLQTEVESMIGETKIEAVSAGGEPHPCQIAIVGVGIRPEVEIARGTELGLGDRGGLIVDERMRTTVEGVWAAGDCCETRHLIHGGPTYVPLGTTANKQGRVAGANIAGHEEEFPGVVGTAAVRVCDLEVARTGLCTSEAAAAGFDAAAVTIEHISRARYYPGCSKMTVTMVVERGSGRLLGAQLAGYEGVAKRVDVVATALHCGVSARQFAQFDLSYAPPFAPVWDPLLIAARKAAEAAESA